MNYDGDTKPSRSWPLKVVVLISIIGLLVVIAIPNFFGGGPSKLNSIISHLHQIDGAKQQWALDHGISNATQVVRKLTEQDIAPYCIRKDNEDHFDRFGSGFDRKGHVHPVDGEEYLINSLAVSPEAKLSRRDYSFPKGTIIRLGRDREEYIFPGQESKPYRWINGILTNDF